jgi:hypothetical protein
MIPRVSSGGPRVQLLERACIKTGSVCVLYSSVCPREREGGSDNGRKGSHLVASWDEMLKRLEPVVDLAPSLLQKRTKKTLFYDDRKCID